MARPIRDPLRVLYEDRKWTIRDIADARRWSYSTARRHLIAVGTQLRPNGTMPGRFLAPGVDHDEIVRLRLHLGMSARVVAAQLGCHHSTVDRVVRLRLAGLRTP